MKHPKTTIAGILTIIVGVGGVAIKFLVTGHIGTEELAAAGAAITAGLGLIHGADAK